MGKQKPYALVGKSRSALYFIIATCGAILYHFAASAWLADNSPILFFLPLLIGGGVSAVSHFNAKKIKRLQDIANSQQEQLTHRRTENAQLRVRLVDVERKSRNTRRELQRVRRKFFDSAMEAGNKFETTFHATPDPMLLADLNSGLVTDVNESFLQLLNFRWQDVYNNTVDSIFTWPTEEDADKFEQALNTGESINNLMSISKSADGETFVALVSMRSLSIAGRRTAIIAVRDYSDLHAAQHEVRLYSKALEQSPAGTAILSIEGKVDYVNPRFTQITGYTAEELHGNEVPFLRDQALKSNFSWSMLTSLKEWREDIFTLRKDKKKCWLSVSISPVKEHNNLARYVLILEDITQKKEQEQRIQHMAMHDGLTSLANRRHFRIHLNQCIELQHRSQVPFALVFIDLNKFKDINDTRGHDVGDEVLKTISKRLKRILREVDLVARPGGDEFLLILSGVQSLEDLNTTLTRIAYHIARPMDFGQSTQTIMTAAMGVAMCPEHGVNADELLSKADHAMYACKRSTEAPFVVWDPTIEMPGEVA